MKNCCAGRGTVSGAECVPLHWNHGDRGAAGAGTGGLIDLYFGLETGGADEAFFDAPVSEAYKKNQPRGSGSGSGAARPEGGQPQHVRPGVLELCRMADMVFLALHGTCGEDGRVQAAFDLMGIPYTGAGIWAAPSPWTRI